MKAKHKMHKIVSKLMVILLLVMTLQLALPLAVYADNRDEMLGVWRGTFINTTGLHGIEMVVFLDELGNYTAVSWFFPVEGGAARPISGQYRSDFIFDSASGRFETMNCTWISGSGNLARKTLALHGDNLIGHMISSITGLHHTDFTYNMTRIPESNFILGVGHVHLAGNQSRVITEATCQSEGLAVYDCVFCNSIAYEAILPELPHTPDGNWIVEREPACDVPGVRVQLCEICDGVAIVEEIPKTEHTPSEIWMVLIEPTETTEGVKVMPCADCDYQVARLPIIYGAEPSGVLPPAQLEPDEDDEAEEMGILSGEFLRYVIIGVVVILIIGLIILLLSRKKRGKSQSEMPEQSNADTTPLVRQQPVIPQQMSSPQPTEMLRQSETPRTELLHQPTEMLRQSEARTELLHQPVNHANPNIVGEYVPTSKNICEKCGYQLSEGKPFCGVCGHRASNVNERKNICSHCGKPIKEGAGFCGSCGQKR